MGDPSPGPECCRLLWCLPVDHHPHCSWHTDCRGSDFLSGSFNRLQNQLQNLLATFTRITESALYLQDYFDFLAIVPTIKDSPGLLMHHNRSRKAFGLKTLDLNIPALKSGPYGISASCSIPVKNLPSSVKMVPAKLPLSSCSPACMIHQKARS